MADVSGALAGIGEHNALRGHSQPKHHVQLQHSQLIFSFGSTYLRFLFHQGKLAQSCPSF